jgi:hypothetical protein
MTRGDALEALWILAGRPLVPTSGTGSAFDWAVSRRIVALSSSQSQPQASWAHWLKRAVLTGFLYRAAGRPPCLAPTHSPFTDVAPEHELFQAMWWCSVQGVLVGQRHQDQIEYRPDQPMTRRELAGALFRFCLDPVAAGPTQVRPSPEP